MLHVLPTTFEHVLQQTKLQGSSFEGGKTRNIAIQLILQQTRKTSCKYLVARFTVLLDSRDRKNWKLGPNSFPKTVPQCNSTQTRPSPTLTLKMANVSLTSNKRTETIYSTDAVLLIPSVLWCRNPFAGCRNIYKACAGLAEDLTK